MTGTTGKKAYGAALFALFMFVQLTVLSCGNHAGEGFLSTTQRESVYYALQLFVIGGYLAHALIFRALPNARSRRLPSGVAMLFLALGAAFMLFAPSGSAAYLAVTAFTVFFLGHLGGMVYERMSRMTAGTGSAAFAMGTGCAAGVALQYALQLQWGATPLLAPAVLASLILLAKGSLFDDNAVTADPFTVLERPVPRLRLICACLITAALLFFAAFYNAYIHHLQILTGYTDYNVYSWPRLMMIPCYLLFALIGDLRGGKLVPPAALCIALLALLNSVLSANADAYRLNMCLFYCALAAAVSYYDLTFWRLAPKTKRPALWAPMGRILDSVSVLAAAAVHLSALPGAAVLALNLLVLACVILLMTLNGDLDLRADAQEAGAAAEDDESERIARFSASFRLTARETDVLTAVLHSDLSTPKLAFELGMGERTLYRHLSSIYEKTGTDSRMALVMRLRGE